ncbi:hypothetical protein [Desulfoferrobacter suflitae]|uniref:hypothetical protein n=1 Tax=Desulfoferrobacter suflitae TaxID=2865782 RepID=UPI003EBBA732
MPFHDKRHPLDMGGVEINRFLERKYPNANREWGRQYVFPAQKHSGDPRTGLDRRHHCSEGILQRNIKAAARKTLIHKPVGPHTLPFVCNPFVAERL